MVGAQDIFLRNICMDMGADDGGFSSINRQGKVEGGASHLIIVRRLMYILLRPPALDIIKTSQEII